VIRTNAKDVFPDDVFQSFGDMVDGSQQVSTETCQYHHDAHRWDLHGHEPTEMSQAVGYFIRNASNTYVGIRHALRSLCQPVPLESTFEAGELVA